MSRTFTITELNEKIDQAICGYECDFERLKNDESVEKLEIAAKIVALQDLKFELNDPNPIVNVTEKVQETLNVITAQNIVNNDL